MKIITCFIFLLLFPYCCIFAQCPSLDFNITGSSCKGGNVIVANKSIGANSYEWDFCDGDLEGLPTGSLVSTLSGSTAYWGLFLIKDSSNWYGFVAGNNTNKLFKVSFGKSLTNIPTYTDLGNINGKLNKPGDIKIIKEGNNWLGLVTNNASAELVKISFGSSLDNTPTAEVISLPTGTLSNPRGIEIIQESNKYFALVTNTTSTNLTRLDFDNSLNNVPGVSQISVSASASTTEVAVVRVCDKIFALLTSSGNGRVIKLNFGTSILTIPQITTLTLSGITTTPVQVAIVTDRNKYKGYVALKGGIIKELDFATDFSTNAPIVRDLNGLGFTSNVSGFTLINDKSTWIGMGVDLSSGKINKITFPDACLGLMGLSEESEPIVKYSGEGTYNITLRGRNSNGSTSLLTKQVFIGSSDAPQGDFTSTVECVEAPISFNATINDGELINKWSWDFGDPTTGINNTSSVQNPSHLFSSAGVYRVKLSITGTNGCENIIIKNDTVYNSTSTNFSIPSGTICTNQQILFSNTSIGEAGSKVNWLWEFLDSNNNLIATSTKKDTVFHFNNEGNYTVRLTGGVKGCSVTSSKSIAVVEGPVVNFSYSNNCPNTALTFSDESRGNGVIGNQWEVINSENIVIASSSNSATYSFLFPSLGIYSVRLKVFSSSGCNSSIEKTLTISNAKKVDFILPSATENIPVSFSGLDLSENGDQIDQWWWDFGNEKINGKDASFSFSSAGPHNVKLIVRTRQGCLDSVTKSLMVKVSECPLVDFEMETTSCKQGNVLLTNKSLNANTYTWDFCDGDLDRSPIGDLLTTLTGSASYLGVALVENGTEWYGFVTGNNSNKLYKLVFGNNINNIPTVIDYGNIDNKLSGPTGIKLIKEGEDWIGLICNTSSSELVKLSFGTSLDNKPTAVGITLPFGTLNNPRGIEVKKDNNKFVVFVTNTGSSNLTQLDFDISFGNFPVVNQIALSGASGVTDVAVVKVCNKWFGLLPSSGNGKIYKLDFGTSLLSSPTVGVLSLTGSTPTPAQVFIARTLNKFKAYIALRGGTIKELDFGTDFNSLAPAVKDLTGLGFTSNLLAYTMGYDKSTWIGVGIDLASGKINKITFPNTCSAIFSDGTEKSFEIKYKDAGVYNVTLIAEDVNGSISSTSKQITISDTDAPEINIFTSNDCISIPKLYTSSIINSQTISSWNWNFGDPSSGVNNTSNLQKPSHQFSAPGVYKVKLIVTSENGCTNTYIRYDTIYDETMPNFIEQSGILCSSGPILFTNTSTKETGLKVKWLWDFGDGNTSTEKEPTHTYANGGTYTVTLMAGVEGCSNTFSKDIEVIQGPNTSFSFQNHCLGETTAFFNETIGDNITGYEWDFGDGNTSTIWSPQHTYTAIGKYNVVLKVSNINGCEVTKTLEVQIHDLPVVDFTPSALLCSTDSLQFVDNSTLSDGNITQWVWSISNEQLAINNQFYGKDAKLYFPEPGDYKVTLTATSEAGCSTSATKDLTILKSPEIRIEASNLCAGDSAVLEGVSELENQNIVAWTWQMSDGGMNEGQNIRHKFASPGTYIIYLTAISENSCPKTIVKEVTVYSKPVAKFGSVNNCLNAPVQFTDSSTVEGDVITSWNWKVYTEQLTMINEQSVQHSQFTFNASGNYQVELTVATSHGCSSTIRKTVTIHPLPVASFTFEPEVGPPPFQVQFQNSSTGAVTYFWDFGNGDTSTEIAPQYTYNVLGAYDVKLISVNAFGCSDTIVKKLLVAPPVTSVEMEKILVSTLTEELAFATELTNTGSKIVRSIEFIIDFGGNLSFKETWTGVLHPEEKMTYSIKTQLLKEQLAKVKYICITAVELNNEAFDFETNNVCINLADQFFVFNPQPNPADDVVSFSYILPEDKPLEINFYTTNGQKITMNMPQYRQGYNQSSFSISSFAQGMYFVEFVYGGQRTKKKLVVY